MTQDQGSRKYIKDVTNALEILENPGIQTNPFGANVSGDNSYRRAERIAAAVHLVTSHVAEDEPLRREVREACLRILGQLIELRSGFRASASEKAQSALAEIRSLISLIRLLVVAGYISTANAQALIEATDQLGSLIVVSQKSILAERISLSEEDLVPRPEVINRTAYNRGEARTNDRPFEKSHKKDKANSENTTKGHSDRGERIMDIVRVGGELGIKDIAANLPQYSEKMIQRELADLVQEGRVARVGEKRWSRYRINEGRV